MRTLVGQHLETDMPFSDDTDLPDTDVDFQDDDDLWSLDDERADDVVELHSAWAADRHAIDR
jgi:hypothetical protein